MLERVDGLAELFEDYLPEGLGLYKKLRDAIETNAQVKQAKMKDWALTSFTELLMQDILSVKIHGGMKEPRQ
jgi:hypothetical protein